MDDEIQFEVGDQVTWLTYNIRAWVIGRTGGSSYNIRLRDPINCGLVKDKKFQHKSAGVRRKLKRIKRTMVPPNELVKGWPEKPAYRVMVGGVLVK